VAFGVFNFAGGIAIVAESVLAGGIWDAFGPLATFLAGAVFAMVGLIGHVLTEGGIRRSSPAVGTEA
jgi:hypothetical protein